ncbi:MAG: carboxylate-amine ligase [Thermoleophilia bacterium]|nr:carboxylate-amine ligase [Thermoleophilia bacterium]
MTITTTETAVEAKTRISHAYGESTPYSLGIEEEFQLVDPDSTELLPRCEQLLDLATDADLVHIKHELMQSVVEIASSVCANTTEAAIELAGLRARVNDLARKVGCEIASSGTHPFARYADQIVTDKPRYHQIIDELRWVAQRELIYGLHVHVGIPSADEAMYVFNGIREYLPALLALSANSPFWQGELTGLQSSRSKIFDSFPRSGIPQSFESWADYESLMLRSINAGAIDDYTYVWWDVRPHPAFGTVEVRICDAQTRVEDSLAIAALVQALAAWLGSQYNSGVPQVHHPRLLLNENKWSAARYGLDGAFLDLSSDTKVATRDAVSELIERVRPMSVDLGSTVEFDHLNVMLGETGADRQIRTFEGSGSTQEVASTIASATNRSFT